MAVAVQGEGRDGYVKHVPAAPLEGKGSPTEGGTQWSVINLPTHQHQIREDHTCPMNTSPLPGYRFLSLPISNQQTVFLTADHVSLLPSSLHYYITLHFQILYKMVVC